MQVSFGGGGGLVLQACSFSWLSPNLQIGTAPGPFLASRLGLGNILSSSTRPFPNMARIGMGKPPRVGAVFGSHHYFAPLFWPKVRAMCPSLVAWVGWPRASFGRRLHLGEPWGPTHFLEEPPTAAQTSTVGVWSRIDQEKWLPVFLWHILRNENFVCSVGLFDGFHLSQTKLRFQQTSPSSAVPAEQMTADNCQLLLLILCSAHSISLSRLYFQLSLMNVIY